MPAIAVKDWGAYFTQNALASQVTDPISKYCPHTPHPKQQEFLSCSEEREVFYGGAGGGGKSDALLMGALKYVNIPGFAALILRRTYADLSLPNAIMDRCHQWLANTDAKWDDKKKTWRFPSGATLTFGYLENEKDKYRYQGAELQYIAFDELTQFTLTQYTYLFTRLRRLKTSNVPLQMRSASNPGGAGHEWVMARFVGKWDAEAEAFAGAEKKFIPAVLDDNPSLDAEEYEESLNELDPVTRAQMLQGDWRVLPAGSVFEESWFSIIDEVPPLARWVRYYDLATSVKKKADETAGALIGYRSNGTLVISALANWKREWPETRDGVRDEAGRVTPGGEGIIGLVKKDYALMESIQLKHGLAAKPVLHVGVESQGMQLALVQDLSRNDEFIRVPFYAQQAKGDKKERAELWSARARLHGVELVRAPWNRKLIDQCCSFDGEGLLKDDIVDAISGGVELIYQSKASELEAKKLPTKSDPDYWKKYMRELNRGA